MRYEWILPGTAISGVLSSFHAVYAYYPNTGRIGATIFGASMIAGLSLMLFWQLSEGRATLEET